MNNNTNSSLGMVNLYIFYTLDQWSRDLNTDFTFGNCLLGSVKLTKNADLDEYNFFGYDNFYLNMEAKEKISLSELIWAHLCTLIMQLKVSNS